MIIENIADIHFGKTGKEEEIYKALKDHFIKRCIEKQADIIIINGDSFHSKVAIDSTANICFNKFIADCVNTGATIILIEGTESHDRHQINGSSQYLSNKFFIVNTVTKLNINGLKFLIIPEEYVRNDDYYKEYFEDTYDFVQFHGQFSHVGFGSNTNDEIVRHPFILDYKMFEKNTKYYVIGGHIHTHSVYKNIIYCGSFSRLNFGEEEDKGWIEIDVDPKKSKCSWEFIKNPDAPEFRTILASKLPKDTENLLIQLRGYAENNDFLRITLDVEDDNIINTIKGFVKNRDNCCTKTVKTNKDKEIQKEISEDIKEKQQKLHEQMKEFNGLNFIQITQKIAHDEYHQDFSHEEINKILNTQV